MDPNDGTIAMRFRWAFDIVAICFGGIRCLIGIFVSNKWFNLVTAFLAFGAQAISVSLFTVNGVSTVTYGYVFGWGAMLCHLVACCGSWCIEEKQFNGSETPRGSLIF